jgi:hypothetical protein
VKGEVAVKIRIMLVFFIVLFFMSITICSAAGDNQISMKRNLFAYLIDDCIYKCKAKIKLSESRSKNLRETAALSALKAQYLSANKKKLIDQMLETDLPLKKYKVHHFLNEDFFSYYASKPSLHEKVIEAKLTKP